MAILKTIDIKGLFFGWLLSLVGILILVIIATFIRASFADAPLTRAYSETDQIVLIITSFISSFWTGYIVARVSKRAKILNSLTLGVIYTVVAFFPAEGLAPWYVVVTITSIIPLHYVGAKFEVKRVNKFKNENASELARTPQTTRRPF